MGYQLYRMVRNGAPATWTKDMIHVAKEIADDARDPGDGDDSWPWSALPIKGHFDARGRWRDGLTERCGMSARAVSRALTDLASANYEMREAIGADSAGRPVFTAPGHAMRFRVPPLLPRSAPERLPSTASVQHTNGRQNRRERSPESTGTVAKYGDPISSGSPQNPHTSHPLTEPEVEGSPAPPGQDHDSWQPDTSTPQGTEQAAAAMAAALTAWQAEHPESEIVNSLRARREFADLGDRRAYCAGTAADHRDAAGQLDAAAS